MSTLFNNNSSESGYRLRYLEIYNWGTFDTDIFKLTPNGKTSLLTGANGSGKTTLVDALLTLLVPPGKRFYNQSSGAETKKERDENSYFWGNYGKTYLDTDERPDTETLRNRAKNPYSVLLACFQNAGTLNTITLVQVRWNSAGGLRKVFLVSPYPLNIEEHFGKGRFDLRGEWKRRLLKQFPKTDIFESFKDYSSRFSELFGLKEKALSLFNQTVGIKVLGDLTAFIRQQMLEEPGAEEQFTNLFEQYTDLLTSHKAIQKDERQLAILEPIVAGKKRLEEQKEHFTLLDFIQEQVSPYLEKIEFELLGKEIIRLEAENEAAMTKKENLGKEISLLEEEERRLIAQRATLNIDSRISSLKKDIEFESRIRQQKEDSHRQYLTLVRNLGLDLDLKESVFSKNLEKANNLLATLETEIEKLNDDFFTAKIQLQQIQTKIDETQDSINSYLGRQNRIHPDLALIRKRLAEVLEVGEQVIPFAGELIRVREDKLYWEFAAERVLGNFALLLIVPEMYNKAVNHFVHSNNLKTRLVYQRLDPKDVYYLRWPSEQDSLLNKLEIKDAGLYTKWIEKQLVERFDYYCTDDLEVFYGCQRAVTSNGLKRDVHRHEKDDRPKVKERKEYRLGWDNKEIIRLLIEEKRELENEFVELSSKQQQYKTDSKTKIDQKNAVSRIAEIKSFDDINWLLAVEKIEHLTRQINDLENSSDHYKTIVKQLAELQENLSSKRKQKEGIGNEIHATDLALNQRNTRRLEVVFDTLQEDGAKAIDIFREENNLFASPSDLSGLGSLKKRLEAEIKAKSNEVSRALKAIELDLTGKIAAFINPTEAITKEFPDWSGDLLNIQPGLLSLAELEDLYKLIYNKRLIEHKRRFKDYMDRSMLDSVTSYKTWLENEAERIKEVIEELNVPLKKIVFNKNPDTFLQLESRPTKEQEIRLFKERLSLAIPNALEYASKKDNIYREQVFQNIRGLIEDLQKEESWRRRVTDSRNWLTFNAREYTVAENKAGQYHDNTASYSGGQKAQFTYAILGAAIAHQFGIYPQGRQHKSLRFITVDEAFSKLDPEKSQFLMEFCEQLNLQLLVVTPLDKINIVEDYIYAVHYVDIKDKKYSNLYNLTMEEYRERKEEFMQIAES